MNLKLVAAFALERRQTEAWEQQSRHYAMFSVGYAHSKRRIDGPFLPGNGVPRQHTYLKARAVLCPRRRSIGWLPFHPALVSARGARKSLANWLSEPPSRDVIRGELA